MIKYAATVDDAVRNAELDGEEHGWNSSTSGPMLFHINLEDNGLYTFNFPHDLNSYYISLCIAFGDDEARAAIHVAETGQIHKFIRPQGLVGLGFRSEAYMVTTDAVGLDDFCCAEHYQGPRDEVRFINFFHRDGTRRYLTRVRGAEPEFIPDEKHGSGGVPHALARCLNQFLEHPIAVPPAAWDGAGG